MPELKYTVIKSKTQYFEYCDILEELVFSDDETKEDEIDLLDVLIDKWDNEQEGFEQLDPIDLLKYLMEENGLKQKDLMKILDLTKGTVSKMLNRQSRLTRQSIKSLAKHFKLSKEAFNRDYDLAKPAKKVSRFSSEAELQAGVTMDPKSRVRKKTTELSVSKTKAFAPHDKVGKGSSWSIAAKKSEKGNSSKGNLKPKR